MVCNVPFSCKATGDRNQLGAWLDSDPIAENTGSYKNASSLKNSEHDQEILQSQTADKPMVPRGEAQVKHFKFKFTMGFKSTFIN